MPFDIEDTDVLLQALGLNVKQQEETEEEQLLHFAYERIEDTV